MGSEEFDLVAECPKTQDIICANQSIRVNGEQLGKMLDIMVTDQKSSDHTRASIISQMANLAGTTADKVKQVLSGDVTFVPRRWLVGFAQALDVDLWDLYDAEADDTASYQDGNFEFGGPSAFSFFSKNEINLEKTAECGCGADETSEGSVDTKIDDSKLNTKEVDTMLCPKVEAAVTALIANESTQFIEADRKYLESLELIRLETFVPVKTSTEEVTETVNADATGEGTTNVEAKTDANEEEVSAKEPKVVEEETEVSSHTIDALLSGISNAEHKEVLTEAYNFLNETRMGFVTKITANSEFSEAELEGKQLSELRKINSLVENKSTAGSPKPKDDTNFGLANGSRTNVNEISNIPTVPILLAVPK